MKRILFCLALVAALPPPHAFASNVDFNIGINVGTRPTAVVPVAPPPPPVYHAPPVVIEEPPLFIEPPELGFHVAVGIPQDIFFIGSSYYLYANNVWYAAPHYRGPWVVTRYKALPWKLRRHSFERVRYYRDAGYRHYRHGNDPYWERHQFRPNKEWKEARKAERDYMKHERKQSHGGEGNSWKHGGREDHGRSGHGGYRGDY